MKIKNEGPDTIGTFFLPCIFFHMIISTASDLDGITKVSEVVANTLRKMREYVKPGMNAKELDDFGMNILNQNGARSAPKLAYQFPGNTCISVNHEIAHGIPSQSKVFKDGDLINIDVSAELNGYWADNGGSFVLGNDIHNHYKMINASKEILKLAIDHVSHGVRISEIGRIIHKEAQLRGYTVIKNLTGHGVGKSLHEEPKEIANYRDWFDLRKFKKNSVLAIETFISTASNYAKTEKDNWTLTGDKGGYVAQHEHTVIVTEGQPTILTLNNGIWE